MYAASLFCTALARGAMATPRGLWQPADSGGAGRAQRTVWVEGLPDTVASEQAVRSVLRAGGGSVVSVHVGKQPGTNASCALCLFLHASDAQRACDNAAARPAGWMMTLCHHLDAEQLRRVEQVIGTGANPGTEELWSTGRDWASIRPSPPPTEPSRTGRRRLVAAEREDQLEQEAGARDGRADAADKVAARAWACLQLPADERTAQEQGALLRWARDVDLLRGIGRRSLTRMLSRARGREVEPGQAVYALGQPCSEIHVVVSGTLVVELPQIRSRAERNAEVQVQVLDNLGLTARRTQLSALETLKDSSAAQHQKWATKLAKTMSKKWKGKALQRKAQERMAQRVPMLFQAGDAVGHTKALQECKRRVDCESTDPVTSGAAKRKGPFLVNSSVRATVPTRVLVLDNTKDLLAIGRSVEVAQEETFQRLFRFPGFEGVGCQALRNTALRSKRVLCKAGQILFSRGETVTQHYFLLKGRLDFCIEREDDGIINHIGSAGAGAVLGAFPLTGDDPVRVATAKAAVDTELLAIHSYDAKRALGELGTLVFFDAAARLAEDIVRPPARSGDEEEGAGDVALDDEEDGDGRRPRHGRTLCLEPPVNVQAGGLWRTPRPDQYRAGASQSSRRKKPPTAAASAGGNASMRGHATFQPRMTIRTPRLPAIN